MPDDASFALPEPPVENEGATREPPLSALASTRPVAVAPHAPLGEVEAAVRRAPRGLVVVVVEGRPVGVVTRSDLAGAGAADRAEAVMSSPPVVARVAESPQDALERMRGHEIWRIPVVDAVGRLVALLTVDDVIRHWAGVRLPGA